MHIDPKESSRAGFPNPILHGACFLGITGYHILRTYGRYRSIRNRFSGWVIPGQTLKVEMWRGWAKTPPAWSSSRRPWWKQESDVSRVGWPCLLESSDKNCSSSWSSNASPLQVHNPVDVCHALPLYTTLGDEPCRCAEQDPLGLPLWVFCKRLDIGGLK